MDLKKAVESIDVEVEAITDPILKGIVNRLMNIVENQAKKINELSEENQKLRDENNRLKGEKGKPTFRKQTKGNSGQNGTAISSEKERSGKGKPKGKKGSKKNKLTVNRIELCSLDLNHSPYASPLLNFHFSSSKKAIRLALISNLYFRAK
jgi:regulator of replication initiation timing